MPNDPAPALTSTTVVADPTVPSVDPTKPPVDPVAAKIALGEVKLEPNDTKANPFKADELKLPEGFAPDVERTKTFTEWVNKYGIPRDAALELAQAQVAFETGAAQKATQLWADTQANWVKEVKADPVIGGEKLDAALGEVSKMLDRFGDKPTIAGGKSGAKLREAFELTGAGNHPEIIRFLHNITLVLGEGGPVSGRPSLEPIDVAKKMFPNQN